MKLGFIGAGEMGGAIIKGFILTGAAKENIIASVHSEVSAAKAEHELDIRVYTDNKRVMKEADIVFVAVKPAVVPTVLAELKEAVDAPKTVVCMALGWTTLKLQAALPGWPVLRIMPNTPVELGEGMTLFARGKHISDSQVMKVQRLFEAAGKVAYIPEELFDAATAVSGSGPAFIYYVIDALTQAAVQLGLSAPAAAELAAQMTAGAAKMVLHTQLPPAQLEQKVATPGGCTAAGLDVLLKSGAADALAATLQATVAKAREFAK